MTEGESKVISLSRARKTRSRAKARSIADANAVKFGRSKVERAAQDKAKRQADRHLDGHVLDGPSGSG